MPPYKSGTQRNKLHIAASLHDLPQRGLGLREIRHRS